MRRYLFGLTPCLIAAAFCGWSTASAQTASTPRPIRLVTSAPGGGGDVVARILAEALGASFGYQVIVENRGGAGGIIQTQIVKKANPDGNTLLIIQNQFWLFPFLQENVPYDPVKDFLPVTQPDKSPNVLVVHPSSPAGSVREFIAYAKARPGGLNYARPSTGSATHLAAELLNEMAGIKLVGIPYKGGADVVTSVLSSQAETAFVSAGAGGAQIKVGRLKALAVSTMERSAAFPDLPTLNEAGLPGFDAAQLNAIFVPAGTPATIVSRLQREIAQVVRSDGVKARFLVLGIEPVGSTPQELAAVVQTDMIKWGNLIKKLGLRSN